VGICGNFARIDPLDRKNGVFKFDANNAVPPFPDDGVSHTDV
jgi:hypothetical protein